MSDRLCTNCRAELPRGSDTCPECGVFAGDVFNGEVERRRPAGQSFRWLLPLVILAALGAGGWWLYTQYQRRAQIPPLDSGPATVVRQRPGSTRKAAGATINEAEAIRVLRRSLATRVKPECLAVSSQGPSGGAYRLTAFNTCDGTRLGKFTVDGKTSEVKP